MTDETIRPDDAEEIDEEIDEEGLETPNDEIEKVDVKLASDWSLQDADEWPQIM